MPDFSNTNSPVAVEIFSNIQGPQIPDPLNIGTIVVHSLSAYTLSSSQDMFAGSLTAGKLYVLSGASLAISSGKVSIGSISGFEMLSITAGGTTGILGLSSCSLTSGIRLTNSSNKTTWNIAVVGSQTGTAFGPTGSFIIYRVLGSVFLIGTTGGNWGLGTTALSATLHVQGSISANSMTAVSLTATNAQFSNLTASNLTFISLTAIEITTTGGLNVAGSLDVTGSTGSSILARFSNSLSSTRFLISNTSGDVSITGNVSIVGNNLSITGSISGSSLTAPLGLFNSITSNSISSFALTSSYGLFNSLTSNSISSFGITSTSGNVNSITSNVLSALNVNVGILNNDFANIRNSTINILTVTSLTANSISSFTITSVSGLINGLTSDNIQTTSLTSTNTYINSLFSSSITSNSLTSIGTTSATGFFGTLIEYGTNFSFTGNVGGGGGAKSYVVSPADKPPSVSSSYDDEFDDSTLNTKWSVFNGPGLVTTPANGALYFAVPASAINNLFTILQTGPVAPFTITAKIVPNMPAVNYMGIGVVVYNTLTKKLMSFVASARAAGRGVAVYKWTTTGSFSTESTVDNTIGGAPIYLQLRRVNTTINFNYSFDGLSWVQAFSEDAVTFIESAGTISHIGIGGVANNATVTAGAEIHWFRVNWTPDWDPKANF